jgi:hypothetical protein
VFSTVLQFWGLILLVYSFVEGSFMPQLSQ